jgi:hypothetical protein
VEVAAAAAVDADEVSLNARRKMGPRMASLNAAAPLVFRYHQFEFITRRVKASQDEYRLMMIDPISDCIT